MQQTHLVCNKGHKLFKSILNYPSNIVFVAILSNVLMIFLLQPSQCGRTQQHKVHQIIFIPIFVGNVTPKISKSKWYVCQSKYVCIVLCYTCIIHVHPHPLGYHIFAFMLVYMITLCLGICIMNHWIWFISAIQSDDENTPKKKTLL